MVASVQLGEVSPTSPATPKSDRYGAMTRAENAPEAASAYVLSSW